MKSYNDYRKLYIESRYLYRKHVSLNNMWNAYEYDVKSMIYFTNAKLLKNNITI